jgi:hypothetical protein
MPKPDKDLVLSWITLPVLPEKFWQNKKFKGIKIKATAIHRQIGRPVVLHPTILNELAGFVRSDG